MEVKKYNTFVNMKKPKSKAKPKSKPKLQAKSLSLENKKKLDIIYAKGFVNTRKNSYNYRYS